MIQSAQVVGLPLAEALLALKAEGYDRVQVADITLGRGQAWPLVRVVRQSFRGRIPFLVVCRFPDAL